MKIPYRKVWIEKKLIFIERQFCSTSCFHDFRMGRNNREIFGSYLSEKIKLKKSQQLSGKNNPMFGKIRYKIPLKTLENLYFSQGKTIKQIASELGTSYKTILDRMERNGLKRRGKGYHLRGKPKSEEHKRRLGESHKGVKLPIETIQKIAKASKKKWDNQEWKKNTLIAQRTGMKLRPTKPERILTFIIEEDKLPFNYVGDGKFWISYNGNSFNPDFLSKDLKYIIEVFGDYWHSLPKVKGNDAKRLEAYSKQKYKTLIIWEHELKNPLQISVKIKDFIKNGFKKT